MGYGELELQRGSMLDESHDGLLEQFPQETTEFIREVVQNTLARGQGQEKSQMNISTGAPLLWRALRARVAGIKE